MSKNENFSDGMHGIDLGLKTETIRAGSSKNIISGTFDEICNLYKEVHRVKGSGYTRPTSVIDELPDVAWLWQIVIKAHRALEAQTSDKMDDELFDCAVYCTLLLEKRSKENGGIKVPISIPKVDNAEKLLVTPGVINTWRRIIEDIEAISRSEK